jgi:branched-subunit amino acid transport protein
VRDVWITIGVVAVATAVIKSAGPVLVGGRELPPWALRVIALLMPALLTALVLVGVLTDGERLVIDARLAGLGAGAAALLLRVPLVGALLLAVATTALVRAL